MVSAWAAVATGGAHEEFLILLRLAPCGLLPLERDLGQPRLRGRRLRADAGSVDLLLHRNVADHAFPLLAEALAVLPPELLQLSPGEVAHGCRHLFVGPRAKLLDLSLPHHRREGRRRHGSSIAHGVLARGGCHNEDITDIFSRERYLLKSSGKILTRDVDSRQTRRLCALRASRLLAVLRAKEQPGGRRARRC